MDDDRKTRPISPSHGAPLRTRVLLLILAGVLLAGGVSIWVNELQRKEEPVGIAAHLKHPHTVSKSVPAGTSGDRVGSKGIAVTSLTQVRGGSCGVLPAVTAVGIAGQQAAQPGTHLHSQQLLTAQAGSPIGGGREKVKVSGQSLTAGVAQVNPAAALGGTASGATAKNATTVVSSRVASPGGPAAQANTPLAAAKSIPSTARLVAAADARAAARRNDPYAPLRELKPFPTSGSKLSEGGTGKVESKLSKGAAGLIPPPPPGNSAGLTLPPPPGNSVGLASPPGADLTAAELPAPPPKPSLSGKLTLVAIVADRAILTFCDRGMVRDNRWPETITLGPGEQFESVSLVSISGDNVTLEEDGERCVKTLALIK